MKPVFENPSIVEKTVKENFGFPSFIMMENAASSIAGFISKKTKEVSGTNLFFRNIIFICGKGNNGADGLAAARMLYPDYPVSVYCPEKPKTTEGAVQYEMAEKTGVPFLSEKKAVSILKSSEPKLICDCLYGTGFHGELSSKDKMLLDISNNSNAFRLACDIPSSLYFNAHTTITMGSLKQVLFSDKAKNVCGEIILSNLGIQESLFNKSCKTDVFYIEEKDINLPLRNKANSHKGTYGHTTVIAGEKSGAALLASEAAMNFGSGLTTVLASEYSNIHQFKVNPELMISSEIPKTTKTVLIGSGLGDTSKPEIQKTIKNIESWFLNSKNPACVIDADMFTSSLLPQLLENMNKKENARIVLTPHAKELSNLADLLKFSSEDPPLTPSEALEKRIEIGKAFTKKYPNAVLIMKGANTFIASKGRTYIFDKGCQSLAKGGSGDVLAGMTAALLAQGYNAEDAAITSIYRHGTAAAHKKDSYSLTPKKLISLI